MWSRPNSFLAALKLSSIAQRCPSTVTIVSLGAKDKINLETFRRAGGAIAKWTTKNKVTSAGIETASFSDFELAPEQIAFALAEGLLLGSFRFDRLKSKKDEPTPATISFLNEAFASTLAQATIVKVEYYDAAGKKLRSNLRSEFKKDGEAHWSPGKMTYVDHRRADHKTDMLLLKSTLNNGFKDDEFTQRALQQD